MRPRASQGVSGVAMPAPWVRLPQLKLRSRRQQRRSGRLLMKMELGESRGRESHAKRWSTEVLMMAATKWAQITPFITYHNKKLSETAIKMLVNLQKVLRRMMSSKLTHSALPSHSHPTASTSWVSGILQRTSASYHRLIALYRANSIFRPYPWERTLQPKISTMALTKHLHLWINLMKMPPKIRPSKVRSPLDRLGMHSSLAWTEWRAWLAWVVRVPQPTCHRYPSLNQLPKANLSSSGARRPPSSKSWKIPRISKMT